jgi:hypothetical protein
MHHLTRLTLQLLSAERMFYGRSIMAVCGQSQFDGGSQLDLTILL